jgi:hypothetical protein
MLLHTALRDDVDAEAEADMAAERAPSPPVRSRQASRSSSWHLPTFLVADPGLLGVVGGIGALRTHASSAHGAGRTTYRFEPRHARLAVHAAHTIVTFTLESWDKKRLSKPS